MDVTPAGHAPGVQQQPGPSQLRPAPQPSAFATNLPPFATEQVPLQQQGSMRLQPSQQPSMFTSGSMLPDAAPPGQQAPMQIQHSQQQPSMFASGSTLADAAPPGHQDQLLMQAAADHPDPKQHVSPFAHATALPTYVRQPSQRGRWTSAAASAAATQPVAAPANAQQGRQQVPLAAPQACSPGCGGAQAVGAPGRSQQQAGALQPRFDATQPAVAELRASGLAAAGSGGMVGRGPPSFSAALAGSGRRRAQLGARAGSGQAQAHLGARAGSGQAPAHLGARAGSGQAPAHLSAPLFQVQSHAPVWQPMSAEHAGAHATGGVAHAGSFQFPITGSLYPSGSFGHGSGTAPSPAGLAPYAPPQAAAPGMGSGALLHGHVPGGMQAQQPLAARQPPGAASAAAAAAAAAAARELDAAADMVAAGTWAMQPLPGMGPHDSLLPLVAEAFEGSW